MTCDLRGMRAPASGTQTARPSRGVLRPAVLSTARSLDRSGRPPLPVVLAWLDWLAWLDLVVLDLARPARPGSTWLDLARPEPSAGALRAWLLGSICAGPAGKDFSRWQDAVTCGHVSGLATRSSTRRPRWVRGSRPDQARRGAAGNRVQVRPAACRSSPATDLRGEGPGRCPTWGPANDFEQGAASVRYVGDSAPARIWLIE